jgi:hypothetical protein
VLSNVYDELRRAFCFTIIYLCFSSFCYKELGSVFHMHMDAEQGMDGNGNLLGA